MNISAMRKDWKNEGKNIIKKNINQSLRRGTYNNKNIKGFLTDVNVNGMEKNEAGRKNSIPKGSVHHIYNTYSTAMVA